MTGIWYGFLGVFDGCAVDFFAHYLTVGQVIVRVGGYAGDVHVAAYFGYSAIIVMIVFELMA